MDSLLDRIVIAIGCGVATLAVLKKCRIGAGLLAAIVAWMFAEIALYVAGAVLALLVMINFVRGRTEKAATQAPVAASDGEIIDADFEIVGERREPWTTNSGS